MEGVRILLLLSIATSGFLLMWIIWYIWCNEKTYIDRCRVLSVLADREDSPEYLVLSAMYDTVSYEDHLQVRLKFRDPMLLYPPTIRELAR